MASLRRLRRDRTEVSQCIKFIVFLFNIIFWLLGGILAGVGIWAFFEKNTLANIGQITSLAFDPALILIIVGLVIFFIGFCGCIGALRENVFMLLIYIIAVGIIFAAQLVVGVLAFVYKDWVTEQIRRELKTIIVNYREDPDLQNLIDWVQDTWLKCCGINGYNDWEDNIYFNCSSPSIEKCGVPYSCCKAPTNEILLNRQCGYSVREPSKASEVGSRIFTQGCLAAGEEWLNMNLIPVAGVAVGIALLQILGICCAQNLRSDIFAQKAKW